MSTPLKIPFTEIESITNNFSDEIGKGFFGSIYRGQLAQSGESIDVAVRRLDYSFYLQEFAFDKEIAVLSSLKHENMVSMVGFCYENNHEMIIVNKREARGSLNRHLSSPTLTWMRRLKICVGVASALCYLHNASVIHHNVNSTSILLDANWEAKLSGFEYSMRSPAGDLDLAYEKLGIGSYKSDVFSFGIVLFDILCGAKAFTADDGSFQAPQAIFRHETRKLHESVDPDLFSQMDPQSFNIFSETACYCLKEQRRQPSMNQVFKRLERALKLQQKHENPEHSSVAVAVEHALSPHLTLMMKNLEHLRFRLKDIQLATDNFASKYCIMSGGFGTVYKAKLNHIDGEYCCAIEAETDHELPKKCSKVAIKRIFNTEDESGEQSFYAEIEMLTKCKHSNILTLHGFCDEDSAMILVYEYATNGSLADYLQNKNNIRNDDWAQRMKICLDAAKGLSFLHTSEGDRQEIVHRDIKSDNILLGKNFEAKIGDFGLSKFLSASKDKNTIAGTGVYMDPQYVREGKLKKQIDIYSFGLVLFEVLCGKLAYDPVYSSKYNKGLALLAQQHVDDGTVKDILDLKIKDEITKTRFSSIKGPDQDSVDAFSKIAYRCLHERQVNRPTMKVVIEELEKAILLQENRKEIFQVPLQLIKSATDDCRKHLDFLVIRGEYWQVYLGDIFHDGKCISFRAKWLDTSHHKSAVSFVTELKILMKYKHESLIALIGYCDEMNERIILYDTYYDRSSSLKRIVKDQELTWMEFIEACLIIANGLEFLHGGLVTEERVIHGDISSHNIYSDHNNKMKIAGFEHSVILPVNQETVHSVKSNADSYTEPHYARTGLLSKECDIYSFGVVLCDIMFQKPAKHFPDKDHLGRLTKKGALDEMILECKTDVTKSRSLTILHRIAVQCLQHKRQARPTASEVVTQLREALKIHVDAARFKRHNQFNFSLDEIKSATDKFSDERCIGGGRSGMVYTGQVPHANGPKIIAAKRFAIGLGQENDVFDREFRILAMLNHENIIKIEGYCEELDEKILVYEYASKGSLDQWLNKDDLTWMKRLAICIDIASGLEFIHEGFSNNVYVIHKRIKSSNILLSGDWKAKISDFEFHGIHDRDSKTTNWAWRAKHDDIYPFGGVLLEILCGGLLYSDDDDDDLRLIAKRCFEEGKLDEMVFKGIKGTVGPKSYATFSKIAHQCLDPDSDKRPLASEVLVQLQKALEYQEDYEDNEMWDHKLPTDYERLIQMSKNAKINSNIKKKDLCDLLFSEGILLRVGKVSISFDKNTRSKELISARMFCYKNPTLLKWKLIPESRFHKVSMMSDASNLMIQIKIKTQFLSPNVNYGVHLIFKFGDRKKIPNKLVYVNLKYTMRNETMHAYFAEQRDDKWMQIELFRFFNHNEETDFEVLLEGFSKCYCGRGVVYIEGIEFRAIDHAKLEEMDKLRESDHVLKLISNVDQMERVSSEYMMKFLIRGLFNNVEPLTLESEVDGKKLGMHSVLNFEEDFDVPDRLKVKHLKRKPSQQSRFSIVIEVPPQQEHRIKLHIHSFMLSPNTDYACFIVFKLSEKCRGLHCPVKVRNLLHRNKKEIGTIYFRTPTPWNVHDMKQVSKHREDGWMEVSVYKFNSTIDDIDEEISVDLKLICYEGTMAGLILYGLEFRPM